VLQTLAELAAHSPASESSSGGANSGSQQRLQAAVSGSIQAAAAQHSSDCGWQPALLLPSTHRAGHGCPSGARKLGVRVLRRVLASEQPFPLLLPLLLANPNVCVCHDHAAARSTTTASFSG
jgi:hypothetical protein